MVLSGTQHKALHAALLQEFPDLEHLKHWVRWGLGWNLAEHAHTDTLSNAVFDVIGYMDSQGALPTMIKAAIRAAPQNAALREVAAGLGLIVDIPLDTPASMPPLRGVFALSLQEQQHRQRMIARVRATWIAGVLEQSVYAATRIELGLRDSPDAIANPWRFALEHPARPVQALPPGTSISWVYDQTDGSLLILGAPGAGKTTLLLELAGTCLDWAAQDVTQPIPVVFHLSTWAATHRPLAVWLVAELREKYQVPAKVGQAWVGGDQLLVLLDGLDEVALAQRAACVQAINDYRQEHGLTPLVLCSREDEYRSLSTGLAVSQAVVVQPLTPEQITDYLARGREALAAVLAALDADPELRTLLDTPLMLNILALAYHDVPVAALQGAGRPMSRQQIFAAYTQRMLSRRSTTLSYAPEQTLHWLAQLARQMASHDRTVFDIKVLQPDWLPRSAQTPYRWLKFLITVLVCMLGLGLVFGLVFGLGFGLLDGLGWRLGGGLVFGLVNGLEIGLVVGLVFGLGVGLGGGLVYITHIILRYLLWRGGALPWNVVRFLDYATEHILLRKVGGGYIFIHRLLLEYFAGLETPAPPTLRKS